VLFYFSQYEAQLDRAFYLASFQAASANIDTFDGAVQVRANFLNVREPTTLSQNMGVGHLVPRFRVLPTDFATFCHFECTSLP
jgi:hypothetical protein